MFSLSNVKRKIDSKKVLLTNIFLTSSIMMATSNSAFALEAKTAKIEGADKLINQLIGIVLAIARYVGIILVVWGIIQFLMALRNEDADSKQRATMVIIASIALICAQGVVDLIIKAIPSA